MYYYGHSTGTTVVLLRIPKLLHTRKLYSQLRSGYNEKNSSAARLVADIQYLYCFSLAFLHILACIWYDMTQDQPIFESLAECDVYGDPTNRNVSPDTGIGTDSLYTSLTRNFAFPG